MSTERSDVDSRHAAGTVGRRRQHHGLGPELAVSRPSERSTSGAGIRRTLGPGLASILNPPPIGFREAVLLAWAQGADRNWGALMAWAGWCRDPRGAGTEAARHGWLLVDEQRVKPARPVPSHHPEIEHAWYGQEEPCELGRAIRAAAETLPEQLRKAALTPAATRGRSRFFSGRWPTRTRSSTAAST